MRGREYQSYGCGRALVTLLLLLTSAAAGCDDKPFVAPRVPSVPAVPATIVVTLEGHVSDSDSHEPVPRAVVTLVQICQNGACRPPGGPEPTTTGDDGGAFALQAMLLPNWREALLRVTREGYEPTQKYVTPTSAATAVMPLARVTVVRAGDSIAMNSLGTHTCAFESWPCRRFFVEAVAGESVELEVIPEIPHHVFTLVPGAERSHPFYPPVQRKVTVDGGEVWLMGQGKVTLTARRSDR